MEPDSNQQSKTSSTRRSGGFDGSDEGISMPSTCCRCRSATDPFGSPAFRSSSATEPITTTSLPSAEVQTGRGVPQKRERETAQSRADSSQLWKLLFF